MTNEYENEELASVTLDFEDGSSVEAEILGTFDLNDKVYIALLPQDDTDDIYLYGYAENDGDTFELIDIIDDDEYAEVEAEFNRLIEDMDEL